MPDNLNLNLNLNLDQNLNLGAAASGGSSLGPRFNTEDFCKLNPVGQPTGLQWPLAKKYPRLWDPEHRAWRYVHAFVVDAGWSVANDPVKSLFDDLQGQTQVWVPHTGAARPLTQAELARQVRLVLDASIDRADRALEILDQASAPGALHYWTGMLHIDPTKERYTWLLMLVARKIGEFVAMGLKEAYRMRRPAHLWPRIMPLIDGPDTPSYPSSHSLQAHLISHLLKACVPAGGQTALSLDHLAERVAYNREVAGVHFRMDSEAGAYVAARCAAVIVASAGGAALIQQARTRELVNLP